MLTRCDRLKNNLLKKNMAECLIVSIRGSGSVLLEIKGHSDIEKSINLSTLIMEVKYLKPQLKTILLSQEVYRFKHNKTANQHPAILC